MSYDPESPPFDRRHGSPSWAVHYDPHCAASSPDDVGDYEYDPESPPSPAPPGPAREPEYIPTVPVFNPSRKRSRAAAHLDGLFGPDDLAPHPNGDLVDDGVRRMYAFDLSASKGGLTFLINSSSPGQALSVDAGAHLASVPEAMLCSAVRLQKIAYVVSYRSRQGRRRRVFKAL